ncbi:glycosyltransferase [Neomicrococcus aestuarii]|nr:glycosyltransferase [Neomicrococcus aestuarii]
MSVAIKKSKVLSNWSKRISTNAIDRDTEGAPIRVGFIGRFSSDKGLPLLIEALGIASAKAEASLKLVLAGSPKFVSEEDQRRVRSALETSNVEIEMLGWVAPEEFLSEVDVVVVPSIWPEPFGLVATECMSASVPLVVSDAGALPEIVGEGYPWVSSAGDANSLADSILEFLTSPESERSKVVKSAFKRWNSLYSPETGELAVGRILQEIEGK